jgi:hypothetical protein
VLVQVLAAQQLPSLLLRTEPVAVSMLLVLAAAQRALLRPVRGMALPERRQVPLLLAPLL